MNTRILFIWICTLCMGVANAQEKHHSNFALNCNECHDCKQPTYQKPCLKLFPDFNRNEITVHHTAAEAPELFRIDELSNLYEATIFTHKLHAEMAGMSGGCVYCHHFSSTGKIEACISCHDPSPKRTELNKPGLKGAYHRQCLACHQNWSHENNCISCHRLKTEQGKPATIKDKEAYLGKEHEKIKEPGKLVFKTEMEEGNLVTFYHDDHVMQFDLKCIQCHKDENCNRCHDVRAKNEVEKEDPHQDCIDCHAEAIGGNCSKCHSTREKEHFNHASKGWVLNRFHKDLPCDACHRSKGKYIKMNTNCRSCHSSWRPGKFNHKITGLVLDENHIDQECENCHIQYNYATKTSCDDCHENFTYPRQKPGKQIKQISHLNSEK